jgi:hypothetical protein
MSDDTSIRMIATFAGPPEGGTPHGYARDSAFG